MIVHEKCRGGGILLIVLIPGVAASPMAGLLLRLRGGDEAIPAQRGQFKATQGVCWCPAHTYVLV